MWKPIYIVLLAIAMSGCATTQDYEMPTTEGYEKILNSWVGANINNLINKWGVPNNTYQMPNGNIMYTWVNDEGAIAMPIGSMAVSVDRICKTTFTADPNGKILTWRWEGNICRV